MSEYFIFCEYEGYFNPRAVLVPFENLGSEVSVKMEQLLTIGSKIEDHYEWTDNVGRHAEYRIDGKPDITESTRETVSYWLSLLHGVDHDHDGSYPSEYLLYYINDANRGCSPSELYDRLSGMKEYNGKPITVKGCVMVSQVPFGVVKRASLRFFLVPKGEYTPEEVEDLLLCDSRIHSVSCASKDGKFAGYGFVQLENNSDFASFQNKRFTINGELISFD